jgi:hypothetical protein
MTVIKNLGRHKYGLRKRSVTAGLDRQLRAMYTKWFCALNDDLMRTLTLLEACECCFVGADLPAIGSELRGFGAEGADRSGTPFVKSALAPDWNGSCGMLRRPPRDAMALWVASAPKVRRVWWPWPCQRSTATCKHRTCKGRRTKERQKVPRVKEARPCEDTLEARTK